jgi:hypothetical protein
MVLLEVLVVPAAVAVLIGIAYPSYMRQCSHAHDTAARLMLTMALRGPAVAGPQPGRYTDDLEYLEAMFPEYDFSGSLDESIHLVVGDVDSGGVARALLYAGSDSGLWFGTELVLHGDDAGRHTCPAPWEEAMTIDACWVVDW